MYDRCRIKRWEYFKKAEVQCCQSGLYLAAHLSEVLRIARPVSVFQELLSGCSLAVALQGNSHVTPPLPPPKRTCTALSVQLCERDPL